MDLILASQSPRRRELLSRLGLEFTVRTAEHDETMDPAAAPFDEVARVSRLKAYAVQALCPADELSLVDQARVGQPCPSDPDGLPV